MSDSLLVPPRLYPYSPASSTRLTALLATIPSRKSLVQDVVRAIYKQVDEIRIVFNDYEQIPTWASGDAKILPLLNTPDVYSSSAVWLLMAGVEGYVFVIDDDLIYPDNYIAVMKSKLDRYNRFATVTVHGTLFKEPFVDIKKDRKVLHFEDALGADTTVHSGGVGTCAFHTASFRPRIEEFPDIHSRDPWFALKAAKEGVPIICMERPAKWLQQAGPLSTSIWSTVLDCQKLRERKNYVIRELLLPLLRSRDNGACRTAI